MSGWVGVSRCEKNQHKVGVITGVRRHGDQGIGRTKDGWRLSVLSVQECCPFFSAAAADLYT